MTIEKMRSLSDEELKKLSMRKKGNGTYTIEANRAMTIRRERSCYWDDIPSKAPSFEESLLLEQGYLDWGERRQIDERY